MNSEMACFDEGDWSRQQEEDERIEKQAVTEAFDRIYRAVSELELLSNCGLTSLRQDVKFVEAVLFRK